MTNISEIKVIGIDDIRPPIVRKENYIDLFFKLSLKPPAAWCQDFNTLGHRIKPPAKIMSEPGLIIETYVHDMEDIQLQLNKIKQKITQCNEEYLEKERQKQIALLKKQVDTNGNSVRQTQLNEIVSTLDYES
jgi:hypothetical protein